MLKKFGSERVYRTTFDQGMQMHYRRRRSGGNRDARFLSRLAAIGRTIGGWFAGIPALFVAAFRAISGLWARGVREQRALEAVDFRSSAIVGRVGPARIVDRLAALRFAVLWRGLAVALAIVLVVGAVVSFPAVRVLASSTGVSLIDEAAGVAVTVTTTADNVGELLEQYGIQLEAGDIVFPDRTETLSSSMEVRVRRAMDVFVAVDGVRQDLRIQAGTVRDALAMLDIDCAPEDIVQPALDVKLTPGASISVTRVTYETVTENQRLYYREIEQKDNSLYVGERETTQQGSEGEKEIVSRVEYRDGEEYGTEVISERVLTAPQHRIVLVGTKVQAAPAKAAPAKAASKPPPAKPSGATGSWTSPVTGEKVEYTIEGNYIFYKNRRYEIDETKTMNMTAYTHTGNRTATGVWPTVGTIAVDKNVIALGTRIFIPGYGVGIAQDTGGAINGNVMDLFFDTEEQCWKFGRKTGRKVYILGDVKYLD